ncbi:MAG: hypothetical protein ACP5TI_04990 [Thermoprotei archaeon]
MDQTLDVEQISSLQLFVDLIKSPSAAYERIKEKGGMMPIFLFLIVSLLSVVNEWIMVLKVNLVSYPPIGLQGPTFITPLSYDLPLTIYPYYFFQAALFLFLEVFFNLGLLWIITWVYGKRTNKKGNGHLLFNAAFYAMAPMVITGMLSLLATLMLPVMYVSGLEEATLMRVLLNRSYAYLSWEYLGWIGELWTGLLTAYSVRVAYDADAKDTAIVMLLMGILVALRIYYIF